MTITRRTVTKGLVGLVCASVLGVGAHMLLKSEGSSQTRQPTYDRAHYELESLASESRLGTVGRSFRGNTYSTVIGIPQRHRPPEGIMKNVEMSYKEYKEITGLVSSGTVQPTPAERLQIQDLEKKIAALRRSLHEINHFQRNIYLILEGLDNKLDGPILIGQEGGQIGFRYDLSKAIPSPESVPRDDSANALETFGKYDGGLVFLRDHPRHILFGVEQASVLDEVLSLFESKDAKSRDRVDKLQVERNKLAVNATVSALAKGNHPYAVLIYGANHFNVITPTISQLFEDIGQSYIEFIPAE